MTNQPASASRRPAFTRAGSAVALALITAGIVGGCAHETDNAACRDDQHQTRTDDSRCQDNQPNVDWVHFDPGRRVPPLGDPIDPADTSPFPPSSSKPRGGISSDGATAGDDSEPSSGSSSSSSSSRSGSSGGVYVPSPEPEEDDDDDE